VLFAVVLAATATAAVLCITLGRAAAAGRRRLGDPGCADTERARLRVVYQHGVTGRCG
jgi:hypothetical protein